MASVSAAAARFEFVAAPRVATHYGAAAAGRGGCVADYYGLVGTAQARGFAGTGQGTFQVSAIEESCESSAVAATRGRRHASHSITNMTEYSADSFEELRIADYRKDFVMPAATPARTSTKGGDVNQGLSLLRCARLTREWDELAASGYTADKEFCMIIDEKKRTPLHIAVSFGAPVAVVQALLRTWKPATAIADVRRALPLHLAVASDAAPDVVKALLVANPEAARRPFNFGHSDLHGYTALHWAVENAAPAVVALLLETEPGRDSARVASDTGWTALHVCVAKRGSNLGLSLGIDTLIAVLKAHKLSMLTREPTGNALPLHFAAASVACEATVKCLVANMPLGSAQETFASEVGSVDATGNTPLHYAAGKAGSQPGAARALIDCYANQLRIKNKEGLAPLHIGCKAGACAEVISVRLWATDFGG